MIRTASYVLCLWCVLAVPAARAHSGADFMAVDDFGVGHPGEGTVNSGYGVESYPGGDELSSELGFFVSPLHRVGIGVDARFTEDANGDWVYSSVSPRVQIQLTDPHKDTLFKIGLSVGYQFAEDVSVQETVTTFEEITVYKNVPKAATVAVVSPAAGSGGGTTDPPCNPLFDLDCEPGPKLNGGNSTRHSGHTTTTTSTSGGGGNSGGGSEKVAVRERVKKRTTTTRGGGGHQGIHNHDARQWMSRMVVETNIGKTKVVGNLIAAFPEDDHAYWGYGVGLRRSVLIDELALGLEAIGDFLPGGEHELIASAHYNLTDKLTLRAGVGAGLNDKSPDYTMRVGMLWRF